MGSEHLRMKWQGHRKPASYGDVLIWQILYISVSHGPIINGIAVFMEEAGANGEDVSATDINSVRSGLMGPVAGSGCTMALDGNDIGPLFFTIFMGYLWFPEYRRESKTGDGQLGYLLSGSGKEHERRYSGYYGLSVS